MDETEVDLQAYADELDHLFVGDSVRKLLGLDSLERAVERYRSDDRSISFELELVNAAGRR